MPAPQLEVMLTSATLSVALIGVISGLFGMNLHNTYEDSYDMFVIVRPQCCLPPGFEIMELHTAFAAVLLCHQLTTAVPVAVLRVFSAELMLHCPCLCR